MSSHSSSSSSLQLNALLSGYSQQHKRRQEGEGELGGDAERREVFHGRKSGISRLREHGFYEDNSMAARDRRQLRDKMMLRRKQSSLNRLQTNFEKEVEKVQALQRRLAACQESMAVTAMEKFTITYIQAIWRGYLARKELHLRKAKKFLYDVLSFRFRWKAVARASRVIKNVYRRYNTFKHLKLLTLPSKKARIIQKAYRRRYLRRRGVIRFRAHQIWEHVQLFGICRAKKELCPWEREKRIVYDLFLRFHQKMRARRIFNAANVNKLFLGLYFCQTPLTQRKVKDAATYLKVTKRGRTKNPVNDLLTMRKSYLMRGLNAAILETKISTALEQHEKLQEKKSVDDTFKFFKKRIIAAGLKKMGSKSRGSPLLGSRPVKKPNNTQPAARSRRALPLQKNKPGENSGGKGQNNSEVIAGSFVVKSRILASVTSYRKNVQSYKIPRKLINLSSYSQLDPNSIFASQLSSKTNKVIPYELKGFFRLKTFAEVVFFLLDLSHATTKCPELLQNPFEDMNTHSSTAQRSSLSDDDDSESIDMNLLKDTTGESSLLESIEQYSQPFPITEIKAPMTSAKNSKKRRNNVKPQSRNNSNAIIDRKASGQASGQASSTTNLTVKENRVVSNTGLPSVSEDSVRSSVEDTEEKTEKREK